LKDKIGYAEPHVWPLICKPDATPWYNDSKFKGKHLVASSFSLGQSYDTALETTISPVSFKPPYIPSTRQREDLSNDPTYLSRQPETWNAFPEEWSEEIVKGFARMTGNPSITFRDVLIRWASVHANFISPTYRADKTFFNAPYSIDDSAHISTCCVELFNLLDSDEEALLVRPCIGAVIAEVAVQDQYYLVVPVNNIK